MCGIFGAVTRSPLSSRERRVLLRHAQQRGRDSSGLLVHTSAGYAVSRADVPVVRLARTVDFTDVDVFVGHSRLVTNSTVDNQPVLRSGVAVFHNGIIVNDEQLWQATGLTRHLAIDTEVIAALVVEHLETSPDLDDLGERLLARLQGVAACAIVIPSLGKLVLFSNNGSLYAGRLHGGSVFASEQYPLEQLGATSIEQVRATKVLAIPASVEPIAEHDVASRSVDLMPRLSYSSAEAELLEYPQPEMRRCTRCILPETMPFIRFDADGVCNYCHNYAPRNIPRPREEFEELLEPYRRTTGTEAVVPFSGGRDSCYALHLVVNEMRIRPVTYTYDWGMVTDVGRRNISRMSAALGVENIIVAADIEKKRANIRKNLVAWLKAPDLGMVSVLTAGDKHFFKYVEQIKQQTGVSLNLWGVNPLEVTHFKAGFLGVPPDFEEKRVYSHGARKQLRYQSLRLRAMARSPRYFNTSLWDTLSGEYYRSFAEKTDYFHVYDYWRWDEHEIDSTLIDGYDWECATDTSTTWRIGDGTAAFYNYVYYTIAGFTEHDTFRSNQIREGDLTRSEALDLVKSENQPRYSNLRWYLDILGLDFTDVIGTVNRAERLYER